jgi:quercetin dioxygenase-like cupin family protein
MGNEDAIRRQLEKEGFSRVYVWQDGPNAYYPDHTHRGESAHVILGGEMTLIVRGNSRTFHAGERVDVPGGAVHSARMGPKGCRYLIGEK